MRDFYDIRMLLDTYEDKVNKAVLKDAFAATCKKRGTDNLQEQAEEIIKIIEADGCVNNVPKKPRRIGGRWSVLDRLHIKQAERRQKDNAPQQEQERSRLLRSWNNERLLSKASNAYEARYQTAVVKGR